MRGSVSDIGGKIVRFSAAAMMTVILCGSLAGCGNHESDDAYIYGKKTAADSDPSPEAVTVNFLGYKADAMNLTAIENAIHGFMEENPGIEVKYEGIKGTVYLETFELRMENDSLDDIFMIHHDQFLELAPQGKLADLSDLSTIDGFSELAKSQFMEEDGSVYMIPSSVTAFGLYVNLDMLEENGFDVPVSWPEFSEQCDYFKAQGITPIIGNNFTTLYTLMTARSLYPVYQADNTAELIEAFNSGERDIMEYLESGVRLVWTMIDKGWFDKEELKNTAQTSDDLALFAQGDRPFMITGGWASQRLMDLEPKCKYAIYPYPVLEDGSVLNMDVTTCLSVNAGSGCVEEAKRFVEYLTQPDVIYEYCDAQSCFTPLADDRVPSDQTIAPSAEYLFNGRSIIGSDYRLKLPIDNAEKAVGEAMLDGMGPEEAVKLLGELIEQ